MTTPLIINIMLVCYYSPHPENELPPHRWDSDAARNARAFLVEKGMIDANHRATPLGIMWVRDILATSMPNPLTLIQTPTQYPKTQDTTVQDPDYCIIPFGTKNVIRGNY